MRSFRLGHVVVSTAISGLLLASMACTGGPDWEDQGTPRTSSSTSTSGQPAPSTPPSPPPGTSSSTSSSTSSTSSTSSSGGEEDSGVKVVEQPPSTNVKLDASKFLGGTYYITGTLTLPTTPTAGRGVQLNVVSTGAGGSYVGTAGTTTSSSTLTYAIVGLPAGGWKVQARVDMTGDGVLGGVGDAEGWARGTLGAEIVDQNDADTITVTASTTGVDFALAEVL